MVEPVVVVHGGAWNIAPEIWPACVRGTRAGADAGYAVLKQGGSAVDAVVAALVVMEDDDTFDAGKGSVLDRAGRVTLDAGIMRGDDFGLGAIAAATRVRNPIRAARAVLERTSHVLLTGEGADALAEAQGLELVPNAWFVVPREQEKYDRVKHLGPEELREVMEREFAAEDAGHDTVGAIALDRHGHMAAANSTGGVFFKLPGRVGDSPIPGCGLLADDRLGAVCCTGWGEYIMRARLAARILQNMKDGHAPSEAIRAGVATMRERIGGRAGAIALTPTGEIGAAFNTGNMAWAGVDGGGRPVGPAL